jgi:MoxR-like ATPase
MRPEVGDMDEDQTHDALRALRTEVGRAVVGQQDALDLLLIALMCQGHVLLEDVPGTGKTLLARAMAAAVGCDFRRVQFTPDVLPSDITGSSVYNQKTADFELRAGPIFTQVLLADEINRATPRTQSALLEAMEERQVTIEGQTIALPQPFIVLATQNPIELEGTFPLPEAQLDRFLLRVTLGYPSLDDERAILERYEGDNPLARVHPVASAEAIMQLAAQRATVHVSDPVRGYLLDIVRATRADENVVLGASPRAALALDRASQARALLHSRSYVLPDDVKALAPAVLGHRIALSAQARLRGTTPQMAIDAAIVRTPVPVEAEPAES